jgi:hypothetical protein
MKALIACVIISASITFGGAVGAQIPDDQRPPLVTDYANYPGTPQAFLTPGCDFSGIISPTFGTRLVATGGSSEFGPVGSLADLPTLGEGDLVRMAWTDVAPECIGSAVSFVVKVALGASFDPNVDQLTGPNGGYSVEFLVAGPGEITFPMPDLARFGLGCDYQLDAIVGIPLRDVGPSGSFFTHEIRVQQGKETPDNRTTVISAKNGTYLNCVVPTTTIPVTTPLTAPSTTTTVATTVPPTTVPPTTQEITSTPTARIEYAPSTTAPTVTTTLKRFLAETGPVTGPIPLIAIALIIFGLMFFAVHRGRMYD